MSAFSDPVGSEPAIFALLDMPEATKGALFARYSRSSKSIRDLYDEEFAGDLSRSGSFYRRVLADFGDDSVAQLGGAHVACEGVSQLVAKTLERPRLGAYLEQSTRYVPFDKPGPDGRWRYVRDPDIARAKWCPAYVGTLDYLFACYSRILRAVQADLSERAGASDEDPALARAIRAQALDACRGLLPLATLTNLGIFGTAQMYESLLAHLAVSPLAEARLVRAGLLHALSTVIPEMLVRVDDPEKGGRWSDYLAERESRLAEAARSTLPPEEPGAEPGVRLLSFDSDGELRILAAALAQAGGVSENHARAWLESESDAELDRLFDLVVGERSNRRHRPGRAFEATRYRFEVICDYGAFRDLQRHRMLTIDWQAPTTRLGYELPPEVEHAGLGDVYARAVERSGETYNGLMDAGLVPQAPYALAMAWRVRFVIEMNAREAMHLIELRSQLQGHPNYRRIAVAMADAIRRVGHERIWRAMRFVDRSEPVGPGRLAAERRTDERRCRVSAV